MRRHRQSQRKKKLIGKVLSSPLPTPGRGAERRRKAGTDGDLLFGPKHGGHSQGRQRSVNEEWHITGKRKDPRYTRHPHYAQARSPEKGRCEMAKSKWTRREMLKTGLAISASVATGRGARPLTGLVVDSPRSADPALKTLSPCGAKEPQQATSRRERFLLDFGWRFHLGHACDPSRDFGFGALAE